MSTERRSILVQGEDSESDEEINTSYLTESMATSLSRDSGSAQQRRGAGIVAGEGSETDEEEGNDGVGEDGAPAASAPATESLSAHTTKLGSRDTSQGSSRRSSADSTAAPPPS